ncbi:MAG: helix-turn-helix domain-containing protein [Rubrobacteraceae bacterium]
MDTVGANLRRLRLEAALTQRELATQAGVSQDLITRVENGRKPHPTTVRKLAAALGVEPAELVRDER